MLKEAAGIKRIILACGRTDLRQGIDGLAAMVRLHYGLNSLEEGTLFLFCGKRSRIAEYGCSKRKLIWIGYLP